MQYLLGFVALLATVLVFLPAASYAIKCYSCESIYEAGCAENFEAETRFKYDCAFLAPPRFLENDPDLPTLNATACVKRVFKEHGVQKFVRGCFFGDVNETDVGCRLDPTLTAVQDASCHVCADENFCNGQAQPTAWNIVSLFLFILAMTGLLISG